MSVIQGLIRVVLPGDIKGLYKSLPVPGIAVGETETMGASDGQTLNGCWLQEKSLGGEASKSQEKKPGMMRKLR